MSQEKQENEEEEQKSITRKLFNLITLWQAVEELTVVQLIIMHFALYGSRTFVIQLTRINHQARWTLFDIAVRHINITTHKHDIQQALRPCNCLFNVRIPRNFARETKFPKNLRLNISCNYHTTRCQTSCRSSPSIFTAPTRLQGAITQKTTM